VPKLLLADDSPTTQKVVQLTFADEGIDVVVADDGDTAIELYEHHHPDIVLADINIPGLNGYEVCEAIRKREDNGSTPVILLAGSFEPFDVEEAHRVGANDYLTKPFSSIRRLVATVTALLDSVVRQDAAAEETVEPNSVPPDATETVTDPAENEAAGSPESGPGPALPPEPDPYATDDIENLIQQSFVETVEMPHTVAERMMSEIAEQKAAEQAAEPAAARDEAAFDDELIETTFANEPDASLDRTPDNGIEDQDGTLDEPFSTPNGHKSFETEASMTSGDSGTSAGYDDSVEPPDEFAPSQFEPGSDEATATADAEDLSQASTEEFQIDQSGDETYFEPAPESIDNPAESATQPGEAQTGFEIVNVQEPEHEFSMPVSSEPAESTSEQLAPDQPESDQTAQFTENEPEQTVEQTPVATPWDSVAGPSPTRFQIDDSNLLELPVGFGGREPAPSVDSENRLSSVAAELAPELVDEIARATATQISEELVREIANRIVPRVVEEVLARHRGENSEH
jgi:CheY-like chemotaxis protein